MVLVVYRGSPNRTGLNLTSWRTTVVWRQGAFCVLGKIVLCHGARWDRRAQQTADTMKKMIIIEFLKNHFSKGMFLTFRAHA